jgi:flagellar basal body-associated protein FliL
MTRLHAQRRPAATAIIAIAAIVLLLIAGGVWMRWNGDSPAGAPKEFLTESPQGPLAKMTDWLEPPKDDSKAIFSFWVGFTR